MVFGIYNISNPYLIITHLDVLLSFKKTLSFIVIYDIYKTYVKIKMRLVYCKFLPLENLNNWPTKKSWNSLDL